MYIHWRAETFLLYYIRFQIIQKNEQDYYFIMIICSHLKGIEC